MKVEMRIYYKKIRGLCVEPCRYNKDANIGSANCQKCKHNDGFHRVEQWVVCAKHKIPSLALDRACEYLTNDPDCTGCVCPSMAEMWQPSGGCAVICKATKESAKDCWNEYFMEGE